MLTTVSMKNGAPRFQIRSTDKSEINARYKNWKRFHEHRTSSLLGSPPDFNRKNRNKIKFSDPPKSGTCILYMLTHPRSGVLLPVLETISPHSTKGPPDGSHHASDMYRVRKDRGYWRIGCPQAPSDPQSLTEHPLEVADIDSDGGRQVGFGGRAAMGTNRGIATPELLRAANLSS